MIKRGEQVDLVRPSPLLLKTQQEMLVDEAGSSWGRECARIIIGEDGLSTLTLCFIGALQSTALISLSEHK